MLICLDVSYLIYSYIWQGTEAFPGGAGKARGLTPGGASSYQPVEAGMSMGMQFASSSYDNQGFAAKMHKDGMEVFSTVPQMDLYAGKNMSGKGLEHDGGILPIANKLNQVYIFYQFCHLLTYRVSAMITNCPSLYLCIRFMSFESAGFDYVGQFFMAFN